MTYSEDWLLFRKAEDEYITRRYNVMQDETVLSGDLQLSMHSVRNRLTALRLLADTKPKFIIVAPLVPLLVDTVVDSGQLTEIALAKEVLYHSKGEPQKRSDIVAVVNGYLAGNDEWHYRRVAELYTLLGYTEELKNLLVLCRVNSNPEIQEIAEDFADEQ